MNEWEKAYWIKSKNWISSFTDRKKFPNWISKVNPKPSTQADQNRTPDPKQIYRNTPKLETKQYGKVTIETIHYDRQTATQFLRDLWCMLRSTNLQDEENWQQYTSWFTCFEWITRDALNWIKTLVDKLKSIWVSNPHLRLNWGTEWYDHRLGKKIMAGHSGPWFHLLENHAKAHGAWYTLDIRLKWKEAVEIKKIFPWTKWIIQIEWTIYDYYFHGKGKNHHLHLRMYGRENYKKLFWPIKK